MCKDVNSILYLIIRLQRYKYIILFSKYNSHEMELYG